MAIYKRGNVWWVRFQSRGAVVRQSLETGSREVARDRAKEVEDRVRSRGWREQKRRTIDEAVKKFADEHLPTLRPASARRYADSLMMIEPWLAGRHLDEITSGLLSDIEAGRRKSGVSQSTIRRDLSALSSLVTCAEEWEWIVGNPVAAYMRRRKKRGQLVEAEPRRRYLSHEEEATMLRAIRDEHHPMLYAAVVISIDTGLRREELLGLEWFDVDLQRREITVRAARAKTGVSRTVPILPRSLALLRALPRPPEGHAVIWHGGGRRYVHLYKPFVATAGRLGITDLRWHDLRRTCGCRLLQDHVMPIERVSKWLGHASISQTERAYAFLDVRHLHAAVKAAPKAIEEE